MTSTPRLLPWQRTVAVLVPPLVVLLFAYVLGLRIEEQDRSTDRVEPTQMTIGLLHESGGRELMDSIRDLLEGIEAREQQQLNVANRHGEQQENIVLVALFAGAAIAGTVALLTNRLFARHTGSVEELNTELSTANMLLRDQAIVLERQAAELQTRQAQLEEKTLLLESSNDELRRYRVHLEQSTRELETSNAELLRLNELLEQRTDEAETSNRAKTQFLTAMSHELRTPLNAITGYVDLLELGVYGPITDAQTNSLMRIRYNSRHLLTLINDILHFAKIAAGRAVLRDADVSLQEVLHETESVMRPLFEAKNISFSTETESGVWMRGDRDRIRQILLNLLSNAVKYTDPGGGVRIVSGRERDHVRIEVIDTGWGIPPDMHEAIFDPFVQVDGGPGGSLADGVGLGLAISRELAQAMGGHLTVASGVGAGSTFTLTLQLAPIVAHTTS